MLDGGQPLRVAARGGDQSDVALSELRGWDVDGIVEALESNAAQVGAFIVDPLMTRFGVIPPPDGALEAIAAACERHSILLIFDERVSGFRVHRGGMSAHAGVTPDLAVYGGALGGGFPIGVVAFREGIDEPIQKGEGRMPTPHPVSLAAAEAVLSILKNDTIYERLEKRTAQLVEGLLSLAERFSRPLTINRVGSVFALYMCSEPVIDCSSVENADDASYWKLAEALRSDGVLLPRQPGGVSFVSSSHGGKDIEETLATCEAVLMRLHQEDLP
jgi:glutamate-1-semialdehyde 2,1-aminomutase